MARYNEPELKTVVETFKGVPLGEPNCPKLRVDEPIQENDFGAIEVKVGKIEDVQLTLDCGRLVLDIGVTGSGWGIVFPCYLTYTDGEDIKETSVNFAKGLHSLLEFFGVHNFKDIKGQYIRVEADHCKTIHRFFHVMEDKSFSWDDFDN